MKNLLTATLPALALLALGGCATSGALTSTTEGDGVYYSSADKTTSNGNLNSVYANRGYNQSVAGSANPDGFAYNRATNAAGAAAPATSAPAATTDDANPDYQGGTVAPSGNSSTLGTTSDYYVDNTATSPSGFGMPYSGPGVSTYNYSPSWSVTPSFYGSPFGYGLGLGIGYGYGGGFGGFGSPYGYGGFGNPYAYSGFYDPFYSPFGYGYGSGLSIGFGYGGFGGFGYPFGGYYGGYGSPYYGGGYGGYGYRSYGSAASGVYSDGRSSVLVGPRGSRGGMVMSAQPNGVINGANAPVNVGAGRRGGGMVLGANGLAAPTTTPTVNSIGQPNGSRGAFSNGAALGQPSVATPGGVPAGAAGGRRGGFFSGFFGNGANGTAGGQRAQTGQAQANGSYAPQQRQYSQPSGRSYNQSGFGQPQQRSFSQPSFSQPSRSFGGGGGGGGGSFGGGGGGRRGGR
ncbi:MAG: hypothetical protein ACRYFK_06465 [Janthinobacterium lividum]